jgi:hypothetical protein
MDLRSGQAALACASNSWCTTRRYLSGAGDDGVGQEIAGCMSLTSFQACV